MNRSLSSINRTSHIGLATRGKKPGSFAVVFRAVVVMTAGSGVVLVVAANLWIDPTAVQQSVMQSMDFAWKAGVGAILALLGARPN